MNATEPPFNRRILVVDDNPAIHDDFRKILTADDTAVTAIDKEAEALLGERRPAPSGLRIEVDSAFQGEEALARVEQALQAKAPYAMAFVDMRMPPGWDGLETIHRLWKICLLYTSDAADERSSVDLGGRRII